MKKLLIIAAVCVAGMSACKNSGTNATNEGAEENVVEREVSNQIAVLKLDSLLLGYDMYTELQSEFEKKAKAYEADIQSRGRAFEKAVNDFQTQADKGLLTRSEIAQQQQDLERRQQNLYQQTETKQRELSEENQVMMNKILFSVEEYVKEFNSDYRYGAILTSSGGAPVLHSDPALDITSVILKGLNDKYAKEKAGAK